MSPPEPTLPPPQSGAGNGTGEATRARLLAAAAACFASRGFEGASVREITARAECNVGAITYHFGGKQGLYEQVYEDRFGELTRRRVAALRALPREPAPSLERVLRTFAREFLRPAAEGARGHETMRLFLRELVESRLPEGCLFRVMIRPTFLALLEALTRACPALGPREAELCCHSLIGQLAHAFHTSRLVPEPGPGATDAVLHRPELEALLEHIVVFTAAGIRARLADGRVAP